MNTSSRSINHRLNDLLSKRNISKSQLDPETSIVYASVLKSNILDKDKQEKVNSIVILAKFLDVIEDNDTIPDELGKILDHRLMETLFAVISFNMSTETYKAILKTCMVIISGSLFRFIDEAIDDYMLLYDSLTEYIEVIDVITDSLQLENKITYNTINFVADLIDTALKFDYDGIIPIAERLKRAGFFSKVDKIISADDEFMSEPVSRLKVAYYRLNEFLQVTKFNLSIRPHQIMLDNLFTSLDVSLNESGTQATTEEYIKAGFTESPRKFAAKNFSILSAMELCIILRNPIDTFRKQFHQELMMNYSKTFPLNSFMNKVVEMWINIFEDIEQYPNIHSHVLIWDDILYYSIFSCLVLWQCTKCQLESEDDVDRIIKLLKPIIETLEVDKTKSIEECFDMSSNPVKYLRGIQVQKLKLLHRHKWDNRFTHFNEHLSKEAMDFLCEQRVIQLLKGSWVYTEKYGEFLLNRDNTKLGGKYYFILLSPNRKQIYYKKFSGKLPINPSFEQMESRSINLTEIVDFQSTKLKELLNEQHKNKNLVSVRGTISYEKITLVGENNIKLLSFVTDTEINKYVWLDGLKMLKGMVNKGDLSGETERQLNSLIDIRRNTQLLNLEDYEVEKYIFSHVDYSDDEESYDLHELSEVTKDTYIYK